MPCCCRAVSVTDQNRSLVDRRVQRCEIEKAGDEESGKAWWGQQLGRKQLIVVRNIWSRLEKSTVMARKPLKGYYYATIMPTLATKSYTYWAKLATKSYRYWLIMATYKNRRTLVVNCCVRRPGDALGSCAWWRLAVEWSFVVNDLG